MIWKASKNTIPATKDSQASYLETFYALEDITKRLEDVVDGLEFDGNRLMQVESRLIWSTLSRFEYGGPSQGCLGIPGANHQRI